MATEHQLRVVIDKWRVTYLLPEGSPTSIDLSQKLDALIKTQVAEACAGMLEQLADPGDRSVCIIRSLNFGLNLAVDPALIDLAASQWGYQLAVSIQKKIGEKADDSVVRFPDRASFVAQFIRDLAAGRAWGKWYYQEFEALRSLSVSRSIHEAWTNLDQATGAVAGRLMAIEGLHTVLDNLTLQDAEQVFHTWQRCAGDASPSSDRTWVDRLLSYAADVPFRGSSHGDQGFRDALWWAAFASVQQDGAEHERAMLEAARALLRLRNVLSLLSVTARAEVIARLAENNVEQALRVARVEGVDDPSHALEFFAQKMQGDLDWANRAEGSLLGEQDYVRRSANPKLIARGPSLPSPCAGVFRLGPSFVAGGCHLTLSACDAETERLFRHLVALKCMGGARAALSAEDIALRTLSGLAGKYSVPTRPQVGHLQVILANRQLAPSLWMGEFLADLNTVLIRDVLADEWLAAGVAASAEEARLWSASFRDMASEFLWHHELPDDAAQHIANQFAVPTRRIQRVLQSAADDLDYFAYPALPSGVDLGLTILARGVMKQFARRLIGLELSSPTHLYENILSGIGFVRDAGDQLEIELPSPPLDVVLRLSGLREEVYSLPWIEGREICLRPLAD